MNRGINCPQHEFSVVFGDTGADLGRKQCGEGVGWKGLRTGAGLNFAGAGQERTKNFNPRRALHATHKLPMFINRNIHHFYIKQLSYKPRFFD